MLISVRSNNSDYLLRVAGLNTSTDKAVLYTGRSISVLAVAL